MSPHSQNPQSYSGEPFNIWLANEISETKGHVIAQGVQLLSLRNDVDAIDLRHVAEDKAFDDGIEVKRGRRWDVAKAVMLAVLGALLTLAVGCIIHAL